MKKNICVITGTRAEYGVLSSLLKEINAGDKFKLQLIVMGMHLMREHGYSLNEIKKDGLKISVVLKNKYKGDSGAWMASALGDAMVKMSKAFLKLKPDLVVVIGDRGEMLVAAMSANLMGIPVAHIHGGDVSGNVDELFRHAITKLSHLHFPATRNARNRILKLGEDPKSVFQVGALGLDSVLKASLSSKKRENEVSEKYGINFSSKYVLVVQHPVVAESSNAGEQMSETLQGLKEIGINVIVIYPNSDAGGRQIIKVVKRYEKLPNFKSFINLPHDDFLLIMSKAAVMIGNSSAGIIEAASYKLPVVNVGTRQNGRERGENVITTGYKKADIKKGIKKVLFNRAFRRKVLRVVNPYGDGKTAKRIANILGAVNINKNLLAKKIVY